ncbi:MAG: three-Cys-motif partner protein TcmP [Candidatus Cloacimonadaceae bacterium]|nr:three-Cys-motif partner protein TcmP [Proteiniphilum sp.]
MSNEDFFNLFGMHTEVKLMLYEQYLQKYLTILLNAPSFETIHIYDLFCGKGETDGGQVGSALISVKQAISSACTYTKAKRIEVHLCDKNKAFCDELNTKLASIARPANIKVSVQCKEFKDEVGNIISRHDHEKNSKVLFFIDPYGYKDTPPETLLDLKQIPNTEIMLFLPVSFIYRFIESPQSNSTLDKWKTFMSISGRPTGLSIIVDLINSRFSQAGFYSGSFILNNQQNSNKYAIFFVSSNVYGLEKFNETIWKIDPYEGTQMCREFSSVVIPSVAEGWKQASLDRLTQSIREHISAKPDKMIDNIELYDTVIRRGYLPRHFNEVWKQNQFLEREFITSKTRSNYIGYNYTKDDALVKFRLPKDTDD